jgi:hypothetical protein
LLEKGDVKLSPTTSIPWSRINLVARALSSPPEMREIAFLFIQNRSVQGWMREWVNAKA